jgi:hypothetical protein
MVQQFPAGASEDLGKRALEEHRHGFVAPQDFSVDIEEAEPVADGIKGVPPLLRSAQQRVLGSFAFDCVTNRSMEKIRIELPLDQIVLCPLSYGADSRLLIVEAGQHHNRQMACRASYPGEGSEPLAIR